MCGVVMVWWFVDVYECVLCWCFYVEFGCIGCEVVGVGWWYVDWELVVVV